MDISEETRKALPTAKEIFTPISAIAVGLGTCSWLFHSLTHRFGQADPPWPSIITSSLLIAILLSVEFYISLFFSLKTSQYIDWKLTPRREPGPKKESRLPPWVGKLPFNSALQQIEAGQSPNLGGALLDRKDARKAIIRKYRFVSWLYVFLAILLLTVFAFWPTNQDTWLSTFRNIFAGTDTKVLEFSVKDRMKLIPLKPLCGGVCCLFLFGYLFYFLEQRKSWQLRLAAWNSQGGVKVQDNKEVTDYINRFFNRHVGLGRFTAAISLLLYATLVYPEIPQELGGGRPRLCYLTLKLDELSDELICQLIYTDAISHKRTDVEFNAECKQIATKIRATSPNVVSSKQLKLWLIGDTHYRIGSSSSSGIGVGNDQFNYHVVLVKKDIVPFVTMHEYEYQPPNKDRRLQNQKLGLLLRDANPWFRSLFLEEDSKKVSNFLAR